MAAELFCNYYLLSYDQRIAYLELPVAILKSHIHI